MVSTVPPTACGLATFAEALSMGLRNCGADVRFVEAGQPSGMQRDDVFAALGDGTPHEVLSVAHELANCDVIIVQHEYGIYPGDDGDVVLDLLGAVAVPVVVVAHTVLTDPTDHQRHVLRALCERAQAIVVMTEVGRHRLNSLYAARPGSVHVVPHGAAVGGADRPASTGRRRMLTWGLLGPGKGVEWAIDAFASIASDFRDVDYLVAGSTHPNVLARDGDVYRQSLIERAQRWGIGDRVFFDDAYRDVSALSALIASSDVVVLPYDSVDQVTSGVLVDAVAGGRPVISTAFAHAVELLSSGAGITVPQRDAPALATAMADVLGTPSLARRMEAESRRLAGELSWDSVARRYMELVQSLDTSMPSMAS